MNVCIISENSYPVSTGGVSEWCNSLVSNLPDIDFSVVTIATDDETCYSVPGNVGEIMVVEMSQPTFKEKPEGAAEMKGVFSLLEPVLQGDPLDCESLCRFVEGAVYTAEELIASRENREMLERHYRENYDGRPFAPFFYSWISLFYVLYRTIELLGDLPRPDIYHSLNAGYAGLLGCLGKTKHGRPLLVSEHGLYMKERRFELRHSEVPQWLHGMYTRFFESIVKTCYRYSDEVTSVCRDHVSSQRMIDPLIQPKVVYNGIDTEKFSFAKAGKNDHCVVGTVSRVTPIKDQLTLIRSMPHVLEKHDAQFYVVGDVQDEEYYGECMRLASRLGVEDRIEFTGFQSADDWYPKFDVFVLPSLSEGLPLTILEALSSGVPCVATDVGGIPEILDDEFLVERWDPRSLAYKINWLLEDDDARKVASYRGRRLVEERFSVERMIEEYSRLYEALM